jgi:hypothetical protein
MSSLIEEHINQPVYVAPQNGRHNREALFELLEEVRAKYTVAQLQDVFVSRSAEPLLQRIAWTARRANAALPPRKQAWIGYEIFKNWWSTFDEQH